MLNHQTKYANPRLMHSTREPTVSILTEKILIEAYSLASAPSPENRHCRLRLLSAQKSLGKMISTWTISRKKFDIFCCRRCTPDDEDESEELETPPPPPRSEYDAPTCKFEWKRFKPVEEGPANPKLFVDYREYPRSKHAFATSPSPSRSPSPP